MKIGIPMKYGDVVYLQSLVRQDVKKKQKSIARFAPKPGQPAEEAAAALQKLKEGLRFREDLLDFLYHCKGVSE